MLREDFKYRIESVKYTEDDLVFILAGYNRNLDNVDEDIAIIREWLKLQKHILIETSDREILYFLITCKFSFEKTKQKINMYYCIRSIMPEYYKNCKLSSKKIQDTFSVINLVAIPELTPELNRVIVYKILDAKSPKYRSDFLNSCIALMMDMGPIADISNSNEYIFDLSNMTFEFATKYSLMDLKKLLTIIEQVYSVRIARIHIINAPSYCEALLSLVKTFLKEKLKKRLIQHKGYEGLFEYIPKALLPSDFGGEGKSVAETQAFGMKCCMHFDEHFEKLNGDAAVDEKLKPGQLQNDEILGFHGSFKKLQVD